MEKLKELFSKYAMYIFVVFIIIIIVLLFLPVNKEEKKTSILTLTLKGNNNVTVQRGTEYVEAGFVANDTIDGDLTSRVVVYGTVNSEVVGKYSIRYSVTNSMGKTAEAYRTINVVADLSDVKIEVDYEPKEKTNEYVTINFRSSGEGYDFLLDPDGNISYENEIKYKVFNNDEYIFSVKRKDGAILEEIVKIENIDKIKPTGSCKNVVTLEKSEVTVTANDASGIKKYTYTSENKSYESTSNSYSFSGVNRNVTVTIYDNVGNYSLVNCITVDNTWPVFEHQNYVTSSGNYYDQTGKKGKINYIFYYPGSLNLNEKNALVIFLHGSGEFSSSISNSFNQNTTFVNNMRDGKFQQKAFFLAPQCTSSSKSWKKDCFSDLKDLIDELVKKYNMDSNRISVAGHSLGGGAVFDILDKYPGFFSAGVPLAPANGTRDATNLKDVKIAVFTGTNDSLYTYSVNDVKKLQDKGVNIKLYPLEGKGHAAQPPTFNETNVIEWMIAQSR